MAVPPLDAEHFEESERSPRHLPMPASLSPVCHTGESRSPYVNILPRDFQNNTLLAAGAALLDMPAPAAAQPRSARDTFTGYGGVGDYAASNGDPWPVVTAGHKISQGAYTPLPAGIPDTGESFDLLVVGGGPS